MRVIICGSRDWTNPKPIELFLMTLALSDADQPITVVHGAARGADSIAASIATRLGMTTEAYPADWEKHGKAAGHIRNRQMLDSNVDLVVAFKHDFDPTLSAGGTENMIKIARAAGVRTLVNP